MRRPVTHTKEIAPLPPRQEAVHKGAVGRIVVIGGCSGEVLMCGAPALTANAALRSGAGLLQVFAPESVRAMVATICPCATIRTLPTTAAALLEAVAGFRADVIAFGPGLGDSLSPAETVRFLEQLPCPAVIDADGLNLMAAAQPFSFADPGQVVLTPHPGELLRLLNARGVNPLDDRSPDAIMVEPETRQHAALALVDVYGCIVVLKGSATVVTDGDRLYSNETGNAGMATAGSGDVLTGVVAALIGQRMTTLEAAILGVFLHGLAGDFAAEEVGRFALTATDLIQFLPEALRDHETDPTR